MSLRLSLTNTAINSDQTLSVTFDLAWADATGTEVWKETHTQVYDGSVTVQQVLNDLQQVAKSRAGVVAANIGLSTYVGKTYELQSDGTWKAI